MRKDHNNLSLQPKNSVESMLPTGAALRPLLNDSCLSSTDLNNILKSRGVFTGESDKKTTIPLLMKMVLSPSEFDILQQYQETKESNPKHRNGIIKSLSTKALNSTISEFTINMDNIEESIPYIELESPMVFGQKSKNELELNYSMVRDDFTKDWVRPQSRHSGKIVIVKDEKSNEIKICNEYSSKETDEINKKIIADYIKFMKDKKEVEDKLETISSDQFTNRERFNFLLQLATSNEDDSLKFNEIRDVEIGPDPKNPSKNPDSIIQENIKKIIINGTGLENNALLTTDKEKDNLLLRSIEVAYNFTCNGIEGVCTLQYGFMNFFRNQNTSNEFQVALRHLKYQSGNKAILNKFVLDSFENLKRVKYEEFKSEKFLKNEKV